MEETAPEIIQRMLYNLSIDDILNFCYTNTYYRGICDSPEFWNDYAKNLDFRLSNRIPRILHVQNINSVVRHRITPVIERYFEDEYLRSDELLEAAAKYNNLELVNRIMNIVVELEEQTTLMGPAVFYLLKNRQLYPAISMYMSYPVYHIYTMPYLIIGFYLYGYRHLISRYLKNLPNRNIPYDIAETLFTLPIEGDKLILLENLLKFISGLNMGIVILRVLILAALEDSIGDGIIRRSDVEAMLDRIGAQ